jgi:hypothetical protein
MKGKINGKEFEAEAFGFDGCHKIYLCDSEEGQRQLEEYGYDLYPIEDLPIAWIDTCPLRFIQSGDLKRTFVGQCEPVVFEGWDMDDDIAEEIELMNMEQMEANGEEW